jgi:hypothetical protein
MSMFHEHATTGGGGGGGNHEHEEEEQQQQPDEGNGSRTGKAKAKTPRYKPPTHPPFLLAPYLWKKWGRSSYSPSSTYYSRL